MKTIKVDGVVNHGDRERIVRWLRSGDCIGGDDMVANAIADAIERGDDIKYDRGWQIEQRLKAVAHLAGKDVEYLDMAETLPRLYESGVQYDAALDGESLCDVATILADPYDLRADIESLVAWRCAELRRQGVQASPFITAKAAVVVKLPDGTEEDVVTKLRGARAQTKRLRSEPEST